MRKLTHNDICELARKWVLRNACCGAAFCDVYSYTSERPDVIGFGGFKHTVVVEVKTSRSDFLADFKKPHRQKLETEMGSYRFYCCPKGLISKEELPDRWGLLYVYPSGRIRQIHSYLNSNVDKYKKGHQKNEVSEYNVMYTLLKKYMNQ